MLFHITVAAPSLTEVKQSGRISVEIYASYMRACGGYHVGFFILLMFILHQLGRIGVYSFGITYCVYYLLC